MKNRYRSTKQDQGRYNTTRYPSFDVSPTDVYIFSREGDRLDLLADSFYNDSTLWWIIADANNLGKGSLIVKPGIQLRIPSYTQYLNDKLYDAENTR